MDKYTFHTDPGHGWLEVTRAELIELGITNQISQYSYQKGKLVFLEEDCDTARFLNAKSEIGQTFSFREVHLENTPIRNYSQYTA